MDPNEGTGKAPRQRAQAGNSTPEAAAGGMLGEAAPAYDADYRPPLRVVRGDRGGDPVAREGGRKMKTSVYLEPSDVSRLGWLAEVEHRPQAEILRDAIRAYYPKVDRKFALFASAPGALERKEPLTQDDIDRMMEGFGKDSLG